MSKRAKISVAGKWSAGAFPQEASLNYDDFSADAVRSRVAEIERNLASEKWEVVDGFNFPYAEHA